MAANRQERELMRQRGAGTRQIKDLEFQLILPGQPTAQKEPSSPPKSGRSRRTPQTRKILGPRSSTRKPATARKKRAGKPLSSDIPIIEGQQGVQGALHTRSNQKGKATKKRNIGVKKTKEVTDSNGHRLAVDERPVTIHEELGDFSQANETTSQPEVLHAHGKKRKKRKSIGQNSRKKPRLQNVDRKPAGSTQPPAEALRPVNYQPEDRADLQGGEIKEQSQSSAEMLAIEQKKLPRGSTHDLGAGEVQKLTVDLSKSAAERKPRRKKRKCIGQQRPRRKVTAVGTAGDTVPSTRFDAARAVAEYQDGSSTTVKKSRGRGRPSKKILSTIDVDDVQDEVTQHTNGTDVTRNTRSARGSGRSKKTPSSDDVDVRDEVLVDTNKSNSTRNARSTRGRGRSRKEIAVDAAVQGENNEDDDNDGPKPVENVSTRNRGRPKRNVLFEPSETSNTVKRKRVQEKVTRDPDTIDKKIPIASRKPPKNSMPITVYRMSTNDALDSENDRSDSLINPSALPKNNAVNVVDVLAQICRELVSKSTDSFGEAAKNERNQSKKATLERKRNTIETYGEELDNRLFQLTETLDTNLALSARVRRADKEEKALRAELESLQEEHESIARQTTQIQEANARLHTRAKLASLLRDIEAAVRQGRKMDLQHAEEVEGVGGNEGIRTQAVGNLDFLLRRVGEDGNCISNAGGEGETEGLLDQVKSVNSLLEKAIAGHK
ncbi:hypothetical protein MMC29_008027 [Sticta canariensis]|nr:hypothetical protein [Sticta canariensis]